MENKINVLIPIDFTSNADNAFQYGISFLTKFNSNLFLLNVQEPYVVATEVPIIEIIEEENKEKKNKIQTKLNTYCAYILKTKPDWNLNCLVSEGKPEEIIIEIANKTGIDLLIMAYTIKSRFDRLIFGNLTNKIIENSPCPVLVVPDRVKFKEIKTIAYAAMMTATDIQKINQLTAIAKAFNAEIHIINVSDKNDPAIKHDLSSFKEEVKKQVHYKKLTFESIQGPGILNGIEEYIQDQKIDLICMSTRTRMGLQALFNKSITEKVSSSIDIPILVFHYNQED
jgi:nucleotide-binding universal stress UspA family protein